MTPVSCQPLEKGATSLGYCGGVISKRNRHVLHILIYFVFHTAEDQTQSPVHAGMECSTTVSYTYSPIQHIGFYVNIIMKTIQFWDALAVSFQPRSFLRFHMP